MLNAYACFDRKVGYAQGMAFIVGFFLMYMEEEEAFWLLVSLMQQQDSLYRLRLLFGPGIGGFHLMIYQVSCCAVPPVRAFPIQSTQAWAHW